MAGEWASTRSANKNPGVGGGKTKIKTKDLALITIFASLYAALVYLFSSVSFYALQFRVAGVLRPAIAKKWILAVGYGIGVIVGNVFSPFSGLYELVFMPFMSFVAGILGFSVAKVFKGNYFVAGSVIAVIIPISVSWMLFKLQNLPMFETLPYLIVSEQVICFLGACVFKLIEVRFKWWE